MIDYTDIEAGTVPAEALEKLHRRGCLVVRGHSLREQAQAWDRDIVDHVERNQFFENYRGPGDDFFGSVATRGTPPTAPPARSTPAHPLLMQAVSAIPGVKAGDSFRWHAAMIHGVETVTDQKGWGDVMYIGSSPVTSPPSTTSAPDPTGSPSTTSTRPGDAASASGEAPIPNTSISVESRGRRGWEWARARHVDAGNG